MELATGCEDNSGEADAKTPLRVVQLARAPIQRGRARFVQGRDLYGEVNEGPGLTPRRALSVVTPTQVGETSTGRPLAHQLVKQEETGP
jgi:hypothetical protein